ncbi:MAG: adenosylcobinamide-GDP ribazoletransferase, partial [Paracoccaceae bacterium]
GALHEDGLADCADALGAPVDRARRLEILKDTRIGTFGTLALIVALGLRWASLAALAPALGALGLVLAAAAGRGAIAIVARAGRPARTEGLAAALAPGPRGVEIAGAAVPALAIAIWGGVPAMVALALAAVLGAAVFVLATRRLGGYTGDVFGAVAVSVETAVLVGLAAWA